MGLEKVKSSLKNLNKASEYYLKNKTTVWIFLFIVLMSPVPFFFVYLLSLPNANFILFIIVTALYGGLASLLIGLIMEIAKKYTREDVNYIIFSFFRQLFQIENEYIKNKKTIWIPLYLVFLISTILIVINKIELYRYISVSSVLYDETKLLLIPVMVGLSIFLTDFSLLVMKKIKKEGR